LRLLAWYKKYSRLRRWDEDYVESDATPHPNGGLPNECPKRRVRFYPVNLGEGSAQKLAEDSAQKLAEDSAPKLAPKVSQETPKILIQNLTGERRRKSCIAPPLKLGENLGERENTGTRQSATSLRRSKHCRGKSCRVYPPEAPPRWSKRGASRAGEKMA